jgi:carotenoid cleavage dioxygenase-like enzyme
MVHGVGLRDGQARWYRNRWVRTPGVCATLDEALTTRIDPRAGMLSFGPNTNVLSHAGRTLALVEAGIANYRLTDDLATGGTCDFDGLLAGGVSEMSTALYKHDYASGSSTVAPLDPDLLIGEMSFVPNPATSAEDHGILIGYGYHRGRDDGQPLLLDAETLESVATVHLPQRVPMGFHGNWAPAE